jgi:hypothetical protein
MKYSLILILAWLLPLSLSAQSPCGDNFKKGLRINQNFTAPCDSMVVFSKPAFENLNLRLAKLQKEISLHENLESSLNLSIAHRDSLVAVYQKEVRDFENYLKDTAGPVARLQENLEKSIQNTDRMIKIANRNKTLGLVAGGMGGVLAGLLIGSLAF